MDTVTITYGKQTVAIGDLTMQQVVKLAGIMSSYDFKNSLIEREIMTPVKKVGRPKK